MQSISVKSETKINRDWKIQKNISQILLYTFLVIVGVFILFPFYYMIITSMRPAFFNFNNINLDLLPSSFNLEAFVRIFTGKIGLESSGITLTRGLLNTLVLEVVIVAGSTFFNVLAAYAFAKREFPGKQFLFTLLLLTIILPGEVTLVTKYIMFHNWGLLNTLWALILPSLCSIFGIFLMRQFISTIPDAFMEAARLDGANEIQIITQLIFPLSLPAMATYALFTYLGVWNDLISPLIFVGINNKAWTLQLALYNFANSTGFQYGSSYQDPTGLKLQTLFAGMLLSALPTIIVFVVFQRQLVSGITLTGLKG
jgi:multiple sugar transport system permease protein